MDHQGFGIMWHAAIWTRLNTLPTGPFIVEARIYQHIRGKDLPDLFTRTVDGLLPLRGRHDPRRDREVQSRVLTVNFAGELANEILDFQETRPETMRSQRSSKYQGNGAVAVTWRAFGPAAWP